VTSSTLDERCFNPVLGFYCPATQSIPLTAEGVATVSIPFWVSTVLRRPDVQSARDVALVFQSRSGFLLSCDRPIGVHVLVFGGFNPVLGFYCPATVADR